MKQYTLSVVVLISALILAQRSGAESVTTSTQTTTTPDGFGKLTTGKSGNYTTTTPDKSGNYMDTTSSETAGAEVYKKHCASCHAKDGKGNPKMAAMLKTRIPDLIKNSVKRSDQELIKTMTQGQGKMPAYKDKLSREAQISALTYIRTMAAKEAEKTIPATK